jgi:hypothetical protein
MKKIFALIAGVLLFTVHGAVAQTTFLTNGLIDYFPLTGNANDTVGTNNGTAVGATLTTDRFGNSNNAYSFNGTSYISCPDTGLPSGNAPRTVCLWLEIVSFDGVQITYPFGYGSGDTSTSAFYPYIYNLDSGNPFIGIGPTAVGGGAPWYGPQTDVWYQLAVTYSNSVATLYINGSQVSQESRIYATTLTGGFFIGGNFQSSLGPPTFIGAINDVRIYNRALSSSEISQLYVFESGVITGIGTAPVITIPGTNGEVFTLQYETNLNSGVWQNLVTNIVLQSNSFQYIDASAIGQPQRFYRTIPQ